MSLMAYDHFSWDGAFASDWRWPAAEVLIYLVSAGCGHEGPWVLGLFSGWFFVLTLTWSWAVKKNPVFGVAHQNMGIKSHMMCFRYFYIFLSYWIPGHFWIS
jgi:hypothetical protein